MTQAADTRGLGEETGKSREARIIGLVSAAHFVSHVYIIILPPLFAFIRADYAASYAEIGFAVATFNIVSTVLQAPAGFLVDRIAPRNALILALVVGAAGLTLIGLLPFYWALVAGMAVAGVANTIYHPADYAILAHAVGAKRIGHAFSLHTFFGMLGTAATPVCMLFLAERFGWHGAILGAALIGFVMAAVLLLDRTMVGAGISGPAPARAKDAAPVGWRLLLSPAILRNVAFFILLSAGGAGISNFAIVGLGALHGTPIAVANFALSAFLLANALGVLAGGLLAARTERHDRVAFVGLAASALGILGIALLPLPSAGLVALLAAAGLFGGIVMPSRDMIVRSVTPGGAFGKVFGFVSTGFSIGSAIAPLIYGWLMDENEPRLIFLLVAGFTLLALPLIWQKPASRAPG